MADFEWIKCADRSDGERLAAQWRSRQRVARVDVLQMGGGQSWRRVIRYADLEALVANGAKPRPATGAADRKRSKS